MASRTEVAKTSEQTAGQTESAAAADNADSDVSDIAEVADNADSDVSDIAEVADSDVSDIAEVAEVAEVRRLTADVEEIRELARRKQAEFENYRKRVERERYELVAHASSELMLEILPVLDNLERALQVPGSEVESQLREGVLITYRHFRDILDKAGLREVEALGKEFDPHIHEAMGQVETATHRDGEVLQVYQKGYFLKERLLRPALVNVAQQTSVAADDSEKNSEVEEFSSESEQQVHDAQRKGTKP